MASPSGNKINVCLSFIITIALRGIDCRNLTYLLREQEGHHLEKQGHAGEQDHTQISLTPDKFMQDIIFFTAAVLMNNCLLPLKRKLYTTNIVCI